MINICLIYDSDNIKYDILAQTPNFSGEFNGCKFHLYSQNNSHKIPIETDALIVLNSPVVDIEIKTYPELTFLISQEAANPRYSWHKNSFNYFRNVYTQWPIKKSNIIPSHGFLTWYIEKSFDELTKVNLTENERSNKIAYIGNKEAILPGQIKRNNFVENLQDAFKEHPDFSVDLLGRTYNNPIENKFETLGSYKYGLAIENTLIDHYWTEKIADIFLAGALPFYIGPKNIYDYFPEKSLILLDFDNIDNSINIIKSAIKNNEYEKRIDAINEARNKVLYDYNLFYALSKIIQEKYKNGKLKKKKGIKIPKNYWGIKPSLISRIKNKIIK